MSSKRSRTGTNPANLERKKVSVPATQISEDGTFCGYASLFGKVDLGKDRVEKGAFAKSLTARSASTIRMLFQHDPAHPIGVWEDIYEDDTGLFVRGKILETSQKGREVLSLLREGALDGLSIGFRTRRSTTDRKTGVRSIIEAELWEISVVTFPMLPQARVLKVKSDMKDTAHSQLPSVREFERWLTRDAGLSRKEARTVIGKGFAHLVCKRDAATPVESELARNIRMAARSIISPSNKRKIT
ncbi:MAG: HK97 family phage prohead protease [Pseudomonadota bacterium]